MAEGQSAPASSVVVATRANVVLYDVVIPTIGRRSLAALLQVLSDSEPKPARVVLVDDRREPMGPLLTRVPAGISPLVRVLRSGGRGPAAARNIGWRACASPWIAFLDDDVLPPRDWARRLMDDLIDLPREVAASQGRIRVPLPDHRAPTDWERSVAGLEGARWATADMAYRRTVLEEVNGFDERFSRAYREDTELGLRVTALGYAILEGARIVEHPVRDADAWVSIRLQAGNADDVLMRYLHGRSWREHAALPPGRRPAHVVIALSLVASALLALVDATGLALSALLLWTLGTTELAWARIAPGPRDVREIAVMIATSLVLPLNATLQWLRGLVRLPRVLALPPATCPLCISPARLEAVLLDRDGTLVVDVPYNGDPDRVVPRPRAKETLDRFRALGLRVAVVTNQAGIGRGCLSRAQVDAVHARIEELLGPFDGWFVCPHAPEEGCRCRKPEPGLIRQACRALGVSPVRCAVIGDIGSDVEAAYTAGAYAVLVPTEQTRPEEVQRAPALAADLAAAADHLLAVHKEDL